ncbi:MAG: FAD-dependent monooxygenase [Prochlorococcaceae cyanobacterium]
MARSVLIVGAGPAGAALAWLLASRGLQVTLVERSTRLDRQFRGEALMPSGRAALTAMGQGQLLNQLPGRALDGWRFLLDRRELFSLAEPQPGCWLVSQPALLGALIEQAQQQPGFRWLPGRSASPLRRQDGRLLGVQLGDGQQLTADLVVAADGRQSSWRQAAALELEERPGGLALLWFRLPSHPSFEERNLFTTVLADGQLFSLVLGAAAGGLHLAWVLRPGQQPGEQVALSSRSWAERFAALSPAWLADHFLANADAISTPLALVSPVGLAQRWQSPGLLLLGDAAHPMSPLRAQGINMALRDAIVAANHLVPLLNAGGSEAAIDAALAAIEAERVGEIRTIQNLQAAEAARGQWLRSQGALTVALGRAAPLLGPLIARRWWADQQTMRLGCGAVPLLV